MGIFSRVYILYYFLTETGSLAKWAMSDTMGLFLCSYSCSAHKSAI